MTTTETRPAALATARRQRDRAIDRLCELQLAVDFAERGGATVVRLETIRAIVGPTVADIRDAR